MCELKFYKFVLDPSTGGEGVLVGTTVKGDMPFPKRNEVLFGFSVDEWQENPCVLVTPRGLIVGHYEIDTYLMDNLGGRFLSWLSDRPD